jgi:hypothetical protein
MFNRVHRRRLAPPLVELAAYCVLHATQSNARLLQQKTAATTLSTSAQLNSETISGHPLKYTARQQARRRRRRAKGFH